MRRRAVEDLPGCVRVLEAVHAANAYPMWWPADPAGWLSPVGWTAAWVAELAGVVVGHVCVVRGVEDPLVTSLTGAGPDRLGMVSRLFVAPEARGRGLRLAPGCRVLVCIGAGASTDARRRRRRGAGRGALRAARVAAR